MHLTSKWGGWACMDKVLEGRIVSEYVFTVSHWSTNKVQLMLSAKILGPLRPALRCLAARQVYLLAAVSLYLNLKTISLHRTKPRSALSILSDCAAAHWRLCKQTAQKANYSNNWLPKSSVPKENIRGSPLILLDTRLLHGLSCKQNWVGGVICW